MKSTFAKLLDSLRELLAPWRLGALALILLCLFLLAPRAHGQAATTTVRPRQFILIPLQVLTSKQAIITNANLPSSIATNTPQNIGFYTNTLIPFTGSHPIGAELIIQSTNALTGSSNVVVNFYRAIDVGGGNTSGIGTAYGTNFETIPCLTWTATYAASTIQITNFPTTTWEPATAIGCTISNGCTSNTSVELLLTVAP